MNVMHSIYGRDGERFDFCDDEDHEHYVEYDKESDTLVVRQWSRERQQRGGNHEVIATFYSPRRYMRDLTL